MFDKWLKENPEYQSSELNRIDRGVSAYKGNHRKRGLGEVLSAIEAGHIQKGDALVIEAFDRLGREGFKFTNRTFESITERGVLIHTLEDGRSYSESSSDSGDMYLLVAKFQAAHEYSKRLSQRISGSYDAKRRKVKEGQFVNTPNRPMWIDKQGAVVTERAKIPLRAIELYKQGLGQLEVLKTLHREFPESLDLLSNSSEGIEEKRSRRTVLPVTTRSIKRLLTNEALIGQWNGNQAFSPIISIEEFSELQRLVNNRTIPSKSAETYLLSGLLRCSECGGSYNFRTQAARATLAAPLGSEAYKAKGKIVYANCSNMLKGIECENTFTVPYEVGELAFHRNSNDAIESIAMGFALDSLNNRELGDLLSQQRQLESEIEAVSRIFQITKKEGELKRLQQYQEALEVVQSKLARQQAVTDRLEAAKTPKTDFTYQDFLHGTEEQQAFRNATEKAKKELCSNTINLRNELKAYGFKIECGRPKDGSANGVLTCEGNTYSIVRRSQLELCYIVSATEFTDDGDLVKKEFKARRQPYKGPALSIASVKK